VCGLNPKLGETEIPRELYKKYLKSSAGILVPSPFKHHANITAEAMMSKNCVITRPSVPFRVNPSPLKGGHDCIMVKSENELLNHCNNEFITNRKRQRTIGENALLTAQTSFNMKICINRWEEFFEHVISFS
jgi:glycosyltransferase involved in cell wall biosynthesis